MPRRPPVILPTCERCAQRDATEIDPVALAHVVDQLERRLHRLERRTGKLERLVEAVLRVIGVRWLDRRRTEHKAKHETESG